jgi:predicted permease
MRSAARSAGEPSSIAQRSLIILQAALSLVLLSAAGLLTRSLLNLENQRFGVNTDGRLIVRMDPPVSLYRPDQLQSFYQHLQEKLERIPGVITASFSDFSPMSGAIGGEPVSIEGRPGWRPDLGGVKWPNENRVSAHYFETIGTCVLRGRPITEQDTPNSQHVAVIDQTFARLYFPNQDPIGRHFGIQEESHAGDYEIIGVVEDAEYSNPKQANVPTFFLPLLQEEKYSDTAEDLEQASSKYIRDIELHVQGKPEAYEDAVRRALDELNPNLGIIATRTFQQQINRNFSYSRMLAWLMAAYGFLALLLAVVGLYGVASYSVARRTNEIGIRMALGADRGNVLRLVLRGAMSPIVLGLVIGVPLSLATARALASQLYDVKSYDPAIFLCAIAVLAFSAMLASLLPARRAASIDPMQALRME